MESAKYPLVPEPHGDGLSSDRARLTLQVALQTEIQEFWQSASVIVLDGCGTLGGMT